MIIKKIEVEPVRKYCWLQLGKHHTIHLEAGSQGEGVQEAGVVTDSRKQSTKLGVTKYKMQERYPFEIGQLF
jgi:hypothetical protein